ncbi:hypothetical protein [Staphylococcus pettenkoferi]|uniref:hypothetical protein n=1 Tax=Staphylococcus pettenkoferi TaxID=170573 RepID=UPI00066C8257|nr:hypothetical protein [Staphylococcus pettenkoferi]MCI2803462.1 hypothetical protein [Staphylococcus pettenkoferi]MCY1573849.1 hypothetical protein [Staphylococcus pettenkoferi]MCY1578356.1 hypothetical protein [Staphylococcus pettenkoferi]MCY1586062.1 hypothetical protein [Staphylococcus pettenkoferi]MCY1614842.1 hypothetical protein [Staphylococcus pettenkoferi]
MKKKLIAVLCASTLLVGCGSQNLTQLEKKTTDLRDKNHKMKLEIQELQQSKSQHEEKIKALQKDKSNMKQAKSNHKKVSNYKTSSQYYKDITDVLNEYHDQKKDIEANKHSSKVESKINGMVEDLDQARDHYTENLNKDDMSADDKKKDKSISKLHKDLTKAFDDIQDGYSKKDKKKISSGQKKLSQIKLDQ